MLVNGLHLWITPRWIRNKSGGSFFKSWKNQSSLFLKANRPLAKTVVFYNQMAPIN